MSEDLQLVLTMAFMALVFSLIIVAATAVWRRKGNMRSLAERLGYSHSETGLTVFDQYADFMTMQVGRRPEVFNVLTHREGALSLSIFDLHYYEVAGFGNGRKEALRRRTVLALTLEEMALPHFFVRPEGALDKLRGVARQVGSVASQYTEGLNELSGDRISGIKIEISRPPALSDWMNNTEIKLEEQPDFSRSHWIKGHNEDAVRDFLSKPVTDYIASHPQMIWEGFGNTFLLSGALDVISHKKIPDCVSVARGFLDMVSAPS